MARLKTNHSIFIALHGQALDASEFGSGTAGTNAQVHIIYTANNGELSYDPDGARSQAALHFVPLEAGLALSHDDFTVT